MVLRLRNLVPSNATPPSKSMESVVGSGTEDTTNWPECVLDMLPPFSMSVCIVAASRLSWVVKAPFQNVVTPPSVTDPLAANPTEVLPPPKFVRRKGDPANTEQEAPMAKPEQLVFPEPGPRLVRTKSRVLPVNVMN